jgi:hypothetical protein
MEPNFSGWRKHRMLLKCILAYLICGVYQILVDLNLPQSQRPLWSYRPTMATLVRATVFWLYVRILVVKLESRPKDLPKILLSAGFRFSFILGIVDVCQHVLKFFTKNWSINILLTILGATVLAVYILPYLEKIIRVIFGRFSSDSRKGSEGLSTESQESMIPPEGLYQKGPNLCEEVLTRTDMLIKRLQGVPEMARLGRLFFPKHTEAQINNFDESRLAYYKVGILGLFLAAVAMRRSRGDASYLTSTEYTSMEEVIRRQMIISEQKFLAEPGDTSNAFSERAMAIIMEDLTSIRSSVVQYCKSKNEKNKTPELAIVAWLNKKTGAEFVNQPEVLDNIVSSLIETVYVVTPKIG